MLKLGKGILIILAVLMFFVSDGISGTPLTQKIQDQIRIFFAERFEAADSSLRVNYLRFPDLEHLKNKEYQIECRSQSSRRKLGYQTIWVHLLRNGQLRVKLPISVEVSIKKPVIVTKSSIGFQEKITPQKVRREIRWIDDTSVWEQTIGELAQVIGKETTHFIPAGKNLLMRDVQETTVVKPGDRVQIQIRAGELIVSAIGIARSAGRVGDYIYVKNTVTGKRLKGKITSPGIVLVSNARAL
ncbi:MAG: flagellar basal body P-ring formation protein FlgA [Calditrichaeota bacterium]|nr:flagellar basal body P-ring formation protein FlgA [Calditrichota bacterium]